MEDGFCGAAHVWLADAEEEILTRVGDLFGVQWSVRVLFAVALVDVTNSLPRLLHGRVTCW